MLQQKFTEYISKHQLFDKTNRLLVAVSGGADSMALLNLLINSEYPLGVAHCNFNLRGSESDEDEIFVMKATCSVNLQFHSTEFNTQTFAKKNKYSIEEAARILRYDWFEKIRTEYNYDYILTAHNADDNIETFFINIIKGTGIRGISGIRNKVNKLIRPLLFAQRLEIEKYCKNNKIKYRTDSSNYETKYVRNKIRRQILPLLEEINPSFKTGMTDNMLRFTDVEKIYNQSIEENRKNCVFESEVFTKIDIQKLLLTPAPSTFLFEYLKPFHFNSAICREIFENMDKESGKIYISSSHELIKDRLNLIIRPILDEKDEQFHIESDLVLPNFQQNLQFEIFEKPANFEIDTSRNRAYLDADKIQYPIIIRTIVRGDRFVPLGMKGYKLLSDFFIDLKLNHFEKQQIKIVVSGDKIVWVCGLRIDERFKITEKTKRILKITKCE